MKAILPGSYDPITVGHLDIIRRAAEIYDEIYVVAFINPNKKYRFSAEERVKMLSLATEGLNTVTDYSEGLVIDYMKAHSIDVIVKGYRNDTDLAYEKIQAEWNKENGGFETVLIKCSPELSEVSSTRVREALDLGDSVHSLLPESVEKFIRELNK